MTTSTTWPADLHPVPGLTPEAAAAFSTTLAAACEWLQASRCQRWRMVARGFGKCYAHHTQSTREHMMDTTTTELVITFPSTIRRQGEVSPVRDAQGRYRVWDRAKDRYGWAPLGPVEWDTFTGRTARDTELPR